MDRLRVTKVDEYQFLTCLQHGLWGSKNARFKDWKPGDRLLLLVGNAIAGLAEVSGGAFKSQQPIWDNGLFPHRVPMRFTYAALPENRLPLLGEVRDALTHAFDGGGGWGLGVLNQLQMKPEQGAKLLNFVGNAQNDLDEIRAGLDTLLTSAKALRNAPSRTSKRSSDAETNATTRNVERVAHRTVTLLHDVDGVEETSANGADESVHLKSQAKLVQLGQIVGCAIWVASNDKGRMLDGHQLGEGCLRALPNMGLNPEATKAIGLIDVIWVRKNAPVAAFEVEATTSIYSGLLRLSDLVEVVPVLKLDLYIVAPKEREAKVLRELARPTFKRIGLADACKFVAIEDLEILIGKLEGLKGHVQPSIIDTIAASSPEAEPTGLS